MGTFAKIKQHYVQASLQKQETKLTEFKNQVFNKFYQVYQTERLSRFQDKKLSQNNEMILNRMVTFSWAEQLDKIWNKEQQKYMIKLCGGIATPLAISILTMFANKNGDVIGNTVSVGCACFAFVLSAWINYASRHNKFKPLTLEEKKLDFLADEYPKLLSKSKIKFEKEHDINTEQTRQLTKPLNTFV